MDASHRAQGADTPPPKNKNKKTLERPGMVAGPGEHGADGLPGTGEMWSLSLAVREVQLQTDAHGCLCSSL